MNVLVVRDSRYSPRMGWSPTAPRGDDVRSPFTMKAYTATATCLAESQVTRVATPEASRLAILDGRLTVRAHGIGS